MTTDLEQAIWNAGRPPASVPLLPAGTYGGPDPWIGVAVPGFADVPRVILGIQVYGVRGHAGATVTAQFKQSADGLTWQDAGDPLVFTTKEDVAKKMVAIDNPAAYLRVELAFAGDSPTGHGVECDVLRCSAVVDIPADPSSDDPLLSFLDNSVETVAAGADYPSAVAISPDGSKAVVACYASPGEVAVIDLSDNSVETVAAGADSPYAVAISPDGSKAVVACNASPGEVAVIDLSGLVDSSTAHTTELIYHPNEGLFAWRDTAYRKIGDPA